jgi:transposase-like protein
MSNRLRYFNSSPEVIRLVVLMYVKYPLSLRNVDDILAEREIDISQETVRFWWNRFGPMFAGQIRKTRLARMRGYEGEVLESMVTAKRDKAAALKFLKRIMKKYGHSQTVVTDGLCSYPAASKEIEMADRHVVGLPALEQRRSSSWILMRSTRVSIPKSVNAMTPSSSAPKTQRSSRPLAQAQDGGALVCTRFSPNPIKSGTRRVSRDWLGTRFGIGQNLAR